MSCNTIPKDIRSPHAPVRAPHTFSLALMDIQSVAVQCFGIHGLNVGDAAVVQGPSQGPLDVKHGY